ncbi:hypothetical protein AB0368_33880 [Actinoplanes sp. NPDC051475]|uniref:hypothetical protein n=1 Tax=Actinoplanes sp. NPDC051475 TaxID=3157225 RepID=UPI00344D4696
MTFGLCQLDHRGRISDGQLMATLGWEPGQRVRFTVAHGVIVVAADDEHGAQTVGRRRALRLPSRIRLAAGIQGQERVLLAALVVAQRLIVHPIALLDRWAAPVHTAVVEGEL